MGGVISTGVGSAAPGAVDGEGGGRGGELTRGGGGWSSARAAAEASAGSCAVRGTEKTLGEGSISMRAGAERLAADGAFEAGSVAR
jgi:hypothetical protein